MLLSWTEECIPSVSGASRDTLFNQCCSARFTFSLSATVPAGVSGSTYYPNNCLRQKTSSIDIGPMIVDMEVVSGGITVDDDLLVNGSIFEGNQHLVILGGGTTASGDTFDGGLSACNGAHSIGSGKILATAASGSSVKLEVADNHGITLSGFGSIILRPALAP
jgi:hypothetical protein